MNKVPKLRFPEFQGEWEEKELEMIVEISKEKYNPLKDKEKYKCIELEHLSQETGTILGYFDSSQQQSIKNKFYEGDILFGKLRPYLKKYWHSKFEGVCSSEIWVLKGIDILNDFLYRLIQTYKFNYISNISSGSKMPRADWTYMSSFPFAIPSYKEQEKIASFFSLIDKKIEKQKQKIEALEEYKKGMMQKIFSQEIRFKDQNGNEFPKWKEKNLGELCTINKGEQINKLDLSSHGNYYALNGGIEPSGYTKNWNTNENTISISEGGASCGYVKFNFEKFWSGGHCYTLKEISEDIYNKYLYQYLKFSELSIMALRVGSGLPNIQKSALTIFKVNIPNIAEQQKITNILSKFEEKIAKEQKKLEELQKLKKGLLQQMFV